ncbi:YebC/PmpR family DNA-binding transcriptional regulator [Flavobacteriales bacterium]|jgi:YebC/PmpR family DNA-binding regulatory protein|nr:YebC/PmpR family DNA-binding transcriptional regulator [Flavobacteriales bacterium]|tara:strand:+ start:535 stop:1248 length:714 start_codon:yes stop_codon:yes gene_type:complete
MGRAFEFRKARKFKRWAAMAKTFTRISKDIALAVKDGGPNIDSNFRLRSIIQNAKSANMPKDNIERAIKNASNKNFDNYKEVILEGYSTGGVAIILDCISDNNNRTVGNIRSYFNKTDGNLATNGSVEFLFKKVCFFKIVSVKNKEDLELELIDFGLIELEIDNNPEFLIIYGEFDSYGKLYQELEKRKIKILESDFERIPVNYKSVDENQLQNFNKFIEICNLDEDIQKISHNLQL